MRVTAPSVRRSISGHRSIGTGLACVFHCDISSGGTPKWLAKIEPAPRDAKYSPNFIGSV